MNINESTNPIVIHLLGYLKFQQAMVPYVNRLYSATGDRNPDAYRFDMFEAMAIRYYDLYVQPTELGAQYRDAFRELINNQRGNTARRSSSGSTASALLDWSSGVDGFDGQMTDEEHDAFCAVAHQVSVGFIVTAPYFGDTSDEMLACLSNEWSQTQEVREAAQLELSRRLA